VVSVEPIGRVALLRVVGELDIRAGDLLADALTVALALTENLLVVDLAACSFIGVQPFESIERVADVLHGRGAQLVVRMPPPSYALIGAHVPPGRALAIPRPPPR
jgi:anti-anti-sigma regulatory factor